MGTRAHHWPGLAWPAHGFVCTQLFCIFTKAPTVVGDCSEVRVQEDEHASEHASEQLSEQRGLYSETLSQKSKQEAREMAQQVKVPVIKSVSGNLSSFLGPT